MSYNELLMRGNTNIRKIIANHFAKVIPPAIDLMIVQNPELSLQTLPYPVKYDSVDPTEPDGYPFIGSFTTGSANYNKTEVTRYGSIEVEPIYETTIFVTTRTANLGVDDASIPKWEKPYRESAIRIRDDLISIMVSVLLNQTSISSDDLNLNATIIPNTIRTSLPEAMAMTNHANPVFFCSGIITVDIKLQEYAVSSTLGLANTLAVDYQKLI